MSKGKPSFWICLLAYGLGQITLEIYFWWQLNIFPYLRGKKKARKEKRKREQEKEQASKNRFGNLSGRFHIIGNHIGSQIILFIYFFVWDVEKAVDSQLKFGFFPMLTALLDYRPFPWRDDDAGLRQMARQSRSSIYPQRSRWGPDKGPASLCGPSSSRVSSAVALLETFVGCRLQRWLSRLLCLVDS